jgi:aspartate kinase
MRVLKFGGTSLGDGRRIRHVAHLVRRAAQRHRVVIVASAVAGVTDRLSLLIDDAVAARPVDRDLDDLARRHLVVLETIEPMHRRRAIDAIRPWLLALRRDLREIALRGECPGLIGDRVMASGERLSVAVLAAMLTAVGCPARAVDGSELVVTDDRFSEAQVDLAATRRSCQRLKERPTDEVPVVTGFVGADPTGRTTTLGRGGSDYSAAVLGAALDAERVEIWTDVDGVLSAPPRIVANATRIPRLSFEEAAELSHFGATVLHPRTVEPLVDRGIPLVVRSTLEPSRSGTAIGPGKSAAPRVVAIAAVRETTVLRVARSAGRPSSSAADRPLLVLGPTDEVLMACLASSDGSVIAAAPAAKATGVAERLSSIAEVTVTDLGPASVVALVGHRMGSEPWVAGRALEALGRCGLTVKAVAAGSSPHALTMLVEPAELEEIMKTVHDALRLDGDSGPERRIEVISTDLMPGTSNGFRDLADRDLHPLAEGGVAPHVERKQREERFAVVGLFREVFGEQDIDPGGVEKSSSFNPFGGESPFELVTQPVQEPLRKRDVETAFSALDDVHGEPPADGLLEEVLGGDALELEARGQAGGELRQVVVEERRPRFQRGEHRRTVDLGQEVVLEVHGEVHVEQLGEAVGEVFPLETGAGRRKRIVAGEGFEHPRPENRLLHPW